MDDTEASLKESWSWKKLPEDEIRQEAERWTMARYGRPYWYYEMIGVIRIYHDGGSIKSEFWAQPQRAFRRNFRHYNFEHQGRVLKDPRRQVMSLRYGFRGIADDFCSRVFDASNSRRRL